MFDDMNRNNWQDEYMWNGRALDDMYWRGRIQENGMGLWNGEERDIAYLTEMYPRESKIIKRLVEEALDMEDYRGSFIYDEYPDKFLFLRMANKIADRYTGSYCRTNGVIIEKAENMQTDSRQYMCNDGMKPWIIEVVQVILVNEIYRRRSRRKYW